MLMILRSTRTGGKKTKQKKEKSRATWSSWWEQETKESKRKTYVAFPSSNPSIILPIVHVIHHQRARNFQLKEADRVDVYQADDAGGGSFETGQNNGSGIALFLVSVRSLPTVPLIRCLTARYWSLSCSSSPPPPSIFSLYQKDMKFSRRDLSIGDFWVRHDIRRPQKSGRKSDWHCSWQPIDPFPGDNRIIISPSG